MSQSPAQTHSAPSTQRTTALSDLMDPNEFFLTVRNSSTPNAARPSWKSCPCSSHGGDCFLSCAINSTELIPVYTHRGDHVKSESVSHSVVCPTLCNPRDCSLTGSFVHGILQARILKWVVISFSRRYSQPRGRTQGSCIAGRFLYHLSHQENPAYNQWLP